MKTPKISDILGFINKIAPPDLAESWDNSGLQLGTPERELTGIMVALEATPNVLEASLAARCNLLVTHHPLIFKPLSAISTTTPQGRLIQSAISSGITIVSIHTSFDVADGGLNDLLAGRLELEQTKPLEPAAPQELVKLAVFVPDAHLEQLRSALFPWAEPLGAYRDCSFSCSGEGTFTPQEGARPFIGSIGRNERVSEQRLEMLVERGNLGRVVKAMIAAHPYEEPAFDIYPLLNQGKPRGGLGRIGKLPRELRLDEFADQVRRQLAAPALRYVGQPDRLITTVALCSGSGASLIRKAQRAGADVLLTGDVKYHDARDAEDLGIAVLDAGHFPTEIIMAEAVAERLRQMLRQAGYTHLPVEACRVEADPFRGCPPYSPT